MGIRRLLTTALLAGVVLPWCSTRILAEERVSLPAVAPIDSHGDKLHQQPVALKLKEGELKNSIGLKLLPIPAGKFLMGSPKTDIEASTDEKPQHRVRITRPFYLGKFEVTRGEFRKFVAEAHYSTDAEQDGKGAFGYTGDTRSPFAQRTDFKWLNPGFTQTDEHPVVNVSHRDAVEFCKWLSHKEGKSYRLPTSAEWEYACRAGTTTIFPDGGESRELQYSANIADSSLKSINGYFFWSRSWSDGFAFTAPAGSFRPNMFGLYDMQGNVWEWCSDWYDDTYYEKSPTDSPKGPNAPRQYRVLRGGSWFNNPSSARAANQDWSSPTFRGSYVGFRVARDESGLNEQSEQRDLRK